jgi:methylglutaconyl-CoA hydratase
MLETIATCPKPVIGRIHGAAFGGGVGLASVCDMVAAVESATFALTEVKLGLLPAVISPFVLRKISVPQAQRYFLTAERFSAATACQMGLVSQIVADTDDLDETIRQWIKILETNGPEALGLAKTLIASVPGMPLEQALPYTADLIAQRRTSAEGQEGMNAFLQKRSPAWIAGSPT